MLGDEVSTLYTVRGNSLGETIRAVSSDAEISPPLYFVLAWLASKLGSAPELIRLPALVAGVAAIPLTYLVGARTVGRTAGMLAATILTLSPFMIFYSTDGRIYSIAIALLLGSTLAMLAAVESGRRRWWIAYGGLTCLAMYAHYTSAFVLAGQLLWLFLAHPEARRPAVLANVGAAILFIPWVPSLVADTQSPTIDILAALQGSGFTAKRLAVENWAFGYPYLAPRIFPGVVALLLGALGIAIALGATIWMRLRNRLVRPSVSRARPTASGGLALLIVLAAATPVGELLLLLLGGTDLFGARNLNTSSAGFTLAVGGLLSSAGPAIGSICAIAVLSCFTIGATKTLDDDFRTIGFKDAAQFVDSNARPADVVVDRISAAATPVPLTPLDAYLPPTRKEYRLYLPTGPPPFLPFRSPVPDPDDLLGDAFARARGHRVFLVIPDLSIEHGDRGEPPAALDLPNGQIGIRLPFGSKIIARRRITGVRAINVLVVEPAAGRGSGRSDRR